MKFIQSYSLAHMTNSTLAGYCNEILVLAEQTLPNSEYGIADGYRDAIEEFNRQLRLETVKYQEPIESADASTDQAYNAISSQAKLNTQHFSPEVRSAAESVLEVLGRYDNPTRKRYSDASVIILNVIASLEELGPETLRLAMVDGWFAELKRRNSEFAAMRAEKVAAKAGIEVGSTKRAREALIEIYRDMVNKLNAVITLHPDEAHVNLANQINELIDHRRAQARAIAKRKAGNGEGGEDEKKTVDSVPPAEVK